MDLKIINILRIDYPSFSDRKETEPIGLYIEFESMKEINLGIRLNIDSSGVTIEAQVQRWIEFSEYIEHEYGVKVTPTVGSPLRGLIGKRIKEIYFGFVDSNPVSGKAFQSNLGKKVAFRMSSESEFEFVFWNDGDEGEYTFNLDDAESRVPLNDVKWIRQEYLENSLMNQVSAR